MIQLHRLGRDNVPFHLNPDLIVTIEAHPDTVVHLTTGVNLVVTETPEEVVAARKGCMLRRQERTSATTSSGVSVTTRLIPVVRCTTVSGCASMVTIRSGFKWKASRVRPRRCSWII